jgi:hypothetical protein
MNCPVAITRKGKRRLRGAGTSHFASPHPGRYGESVDLAALLDHLSAKQSHVTDLEAPAAPGVYAFFVIPDHGVPGITQPGDDPLYIGISKNLAQREFDTHFAAGQSGFSTLRRSLGALLSNQLDLHARPRGTGASDSNYRCYRFDDQGEQRLSDWMAINLRVGIQPVANPKAIEKDLIALACPPLNLTHWSNPDAPTIKTARKACVDEARRAERR